MYMCMRHFKSNDCLTYLLTRESFLDGHCHTFCKDLHISQFLIRKVKNIIYLTFWYNQSMPLYQWINIQESIKLIIFRYFIARNLSTNNSTKNCCHNLYILIRQICVHKPAQ